MKLSVKSDYAARAVLGLARRAHRAAPVSVDTLAEEYGIPPNYLVQILIELKAQNIVRSHRGKDGGYQLARPPAEISIGDIIRSVHGQGFDTPAIHDPQCPPELRRAWRQLQTVIDQSFDTVNFQQLVDAGSDKDRMYYI
ncbi:MAG: Rrf2 family transcriptional regulator [Verrucomicrobiales bacterium]|nr:Rrf2 family transcriptional regulator [Verrucomicrobiales bacterium]